MALTIDQVWQWDARPLARALYPTGSSTVIHVNAVSGNDANPGTQASPKQTIAAGVAALGSGGGEVRVYNGNYAAGQRYSWNGAPGAYKHIMAAPGHRPKIGPANQAIYFTGCSYLLFYGFEVEGLPESYLGDCITVDSSNHVHIWKNYCHDGKHGVAMPGTFGVMHHVDVCYNIIGPNMGHDGTVYNAAASGISYYAFWEGGNDADGFSSRAMGNIIFDVINLRGPITDGNGIIFDSFDGGQGGGNIGNDRYLAAFNITVNCGGRGVHNFESFNCHFWFNTAAWNQRSFTGGELDHYRLNNAPVCRGTAFANAVASVNGAGGTWYLGAGYDQYSGDTIANHNVVVQGNVNNVGTQNTFDKTATGYWKNPNAAMTDIEGWRPDAAKVAKVDLNTIDAVGPPAIDGIDIYNLLSKWPDAFGDYRPTSKVWAVGAGEATAASNPTTTVSPARFSLAVAIPTPTLDATMIPPPPPEAVVTEGPSVTAITMLGHPAPESTTEWLATLLINETLEDGTHVEHVDCAAVVAEIRELNRTRQPVTWQIGGEAHVVIVDDFKHTKQKPTSDLTGWQGPLTVRLKKVD